MTPKQLAFLAAYALTGNISRAAQSAQIDRTNHYDWLGDPAYAQRFEEAKREAAELLEAEARRRAVEGIEEPVIYQGELCPEVATDPETGERRLTGKPLTVRKYSDTLLIFLLKGAMPDKYRENAKVEHSGANGGPVQNEMTIRFIRANAS